LVNIWTRRYSRSATYTGAVFGDADGVYYAELLRAGIREAGRRDQLTVVVVHRLVAECAPHPLELASVRVEDNDAVIAVAVGHEQFVGRLMDPRIGRAMHIRCVGIALALIAVANLHDEPAILCEL
jgi:hypothetical protein